jgi:proteasome-associated ATPase
MSDSSTSAARPGDPDDDRSRQNGESRSAEAASVQRYFTEKIGILQELAAGSATSGAELSQLLSELLTDVLELAAREHRLADSLREAQHQIEQLQHETTELTPRQLTYGIFVRECADGMADVFRDGRKMRVHVSPSVDVSELRPGRHVLLDEALNVVHVTASDRVGEVVKLQEVLADGDRALVLDSAGIEHVVKLAEHLQNNILRLGDSLLYEKNSAYAIDRFTVDVDNFLIEEIPDIDYDKIGGLDLQIQQIREAVELPYLYSDLFERFRLRPPNGILLYGPPGCGKTMLAKTMAKSMAKQVTVRTGKTGDGHFLSIKVEKMLDKYVGETERHIRLAFRRARELASGGMPVIVFLDEMDSLFRIRRSGGRREVEDTTVPQLISEIDGVADFRNIIVVGASNREDIIDPAILRPGRIDLQIRVDRPNAEQAAQILAKFLTPNIPINRADLAAHSGDARKAVADMIRRTIEYLYTKDESTKLFEVTYTNGDKETLYFSDFNSGVTIHNMVDRAKATASRRYLESRNWGLSSEDLLRAADETVSNIRDFATEMAPDDVARISGRKGERIAYVRTLAWHGNQFAGRAVELQRLDALKF